MKRGLLLIDRGSRQREASEELEFICGGIAAKTDYTFVDYCFLEVEPPYIDDGITKCMKQDIDELVIVPYFLYPGRKVKMAVTTAMEFQKDTKIKFLITKPMSMHHTLVEIVQNRIESALSENNVDIPNNEVDVMIIGHGSKDPNAHRSLNYIVDELQDTFRNVSRCWLEIERPDIIEGVQRCKNDKPKILVIVFYFLHEGAHVKTDINNDLLPALEESGLENVFTTKHIGTDAKIIDLIIERAREVKDAD